MPVAINCWVAEARIVIFGGHYDGGSGVRETQGTSACHPRDFDQFRGCASSARGCHFCRKPSFLWVGVWRLEVGSLSSNEPGVYESFGFLVDIKSEAILRYVLFFPGKLPVFRRCTSQYKSCTSNLGIKKDVFPNRGRIGGTPLVVCSLK